MSIEIKLELSCFSIFFCLVFVQLQHSDIVKQREAVLVFDLYMLLRLRSLIVAWPLRPWMTIWRICQDVMAEMLGLWGQEASNGKIWIDMGECRKCNQHMKLKIRRFRRLNSCQPQIEDIEDSFGCVAVCDLQSSKCRQVMANPVTA